MLRFWWWYDVYGEKDVSKIKEIDPDCDIHLNNRKRLERYLTKIMNNSSFSKEGDKPLYNFKIIGLTTPRDNLYNIINNRVDKMVDEGLIDEAKDLYDRKIKSKAIMTGIGYKELYKYFDSEISYEEAIDLIKKNSRHYAKRQYTFFKHQMDVKWFNTNYDDFNETIEEVLEYLK